MFELVHGSNFTHEQVRIFLPNLPEKGISGLKKKKINIPVEFAYSDRFRCQISAYTENSDSIGPSLFKKGFFTLWSHTEKVKIIIEFSIGAKYNLIREI